MTTLFLDNGGHTLKSHYNGELRTERNAIVASKTPKRTYIGKDLERECQDYGRLTFSIPFERGILTNWQVQKTVWDHTFQELNVAPGTTRLVVTEPVLNLPNVQTHYDEMVFEGCNFETYLRLPSAVLTSKGADACLLSGVSEPPECQLIVDSGFSSTTVTPVVSGVVMAQGVRRLNVGGKLLTNYLKELVSFRHVYLMDQTPVAEHMKEETCYVTLDWETDFVQRNTPVKQYVLPDFVPTSANKLGYVLEKTEGDETSTQETEVITLGNEQFIVPEILFNPSIIELDQAGLHYVIAESIAALPEDIQPLFWSNILCVGGNVAFPNFVSRLKSLLIPLCPDGATVNVCQGEKPQLSCILASQNASLPDNLFLTAAEYSEAGENAAIRKWSQFYTSSL